MDCKLLRIAAIFCLLFLGGVDARHYASTADATSVVDYLRGSWLIRLIDSSSPPSIIPHYSHIVRFNASVVDEGTLIGLVEEFTPDIPPWVIERFASAYKLIVSAFRRIMGNTEISDEPSAVESTTPPLFRQFDIAVVEENYVSGTISVDQRSTSSDVDCPGPHHLNASFVAHYSNTEGQPSRLRIASGVVNTDGLLFLDTGGDRCVSWTRRIVSYSFVAVDDSHIHLTLESVDAAASSTETTHYSFLMKRRDESLASGPVSSSLGTIALLVVVALVKFGPRAYLKWKGINAKDLMRKAGGADKGQSMTMQQRLELVKKQREILEEMKSKKLL